MPMSEKAKAAKASYQREWHSKHPEKRRQYSESYWERRAEKLSESASADTNNTQTKEDINDEMQNESAE